MLQLIFNRLMERLDPSRHHLLLMLDEFGIEEDPEPRRRSGRPDGRGTKIKPYLIAQTLTQIIESMAENRSITGTAATSKQPFRRGQSPDVQETFSNSAAT